MTGADQMPDVAATVAAAEAKSRRSLQRADSSGGSSDKGDGKRNAVLKGNEPQRYFSHLSFFVCWNLLRFVIPVLPSLIIK